MKFQLIGVNHKTAPVEVRERLAIPEGHLPDAMRRLAGHPGVEEGMILSTCNRVEMLTQTKNGAVDLRGFLRDYFQLNPTDYEAHLYEYRESDAMRHLFRVASSLDSMVVGEPQILGQVKEAYATARAVGAVHSQLDLLLTRAFAVAKRVRTETAVGSSAVSVASVAVELAKKIFGSLQGKHVYLVGAGKMSELAARHLIAHGAESIFVANRTYERAAATGGEVQWTGHPVRTALRDLRSRRYRHHFDGRTRSHLPPGAWRVVSGAAEEPAYVFYRHCGAARCRSGDEQARRHLRLRHRRPAAGGRRRTLRTGKKEADRAEAIISGEVERFQPRLQTLDVVPTIVSLQDHLEDDSPGRDRPGPGTPRAAFAGTGTGGRDAHARNHQQDHAYPDHHPEDCGARAGGDHGGRHRAAAF